MSADVIDDIKRNSIISQKCKPYYDSFVRFAAKQRVNYENDLEAEWQEYSEKYLNKRLYNTDINLWKKLSKKIMERDKYTCLYCGQIGGKLEIDHVLPISRGGTNDVDNLVTACQHCNRQKHDKTAEEYADWKDEHE